MNMARINNNEGSLLQRKSHKTDTHHRTHTVVILAEIYERNKKVPSQTLSILAVINRSDTDGRPFEFDFKKNTW